MLCSEEAIPKSLAVYREECGLQQCERIEADFDYGTKMASLGGAELLMMAKTISCCLQAEGRLGLVLTEGETYWRERNPAKSDRFYRREICGLLALRRSERMNIQSRQFGAGEGQPDRRLRTILCGTHTNVNGCVTFCGLVLAVEMTAREVGNAAGDQPAGLKFRGE